MKNLNHMRKTKTQRKGESISQEKIYCPFNYPYPFTTKLNSKESKISFLEETIKDTNKKMNEDSEQYIRSTSRNLKKDTIKKINREDSQSFSFRNPGTISSQNQSCQKENINLNNNFYEIKNKYQNIYSNKNKNEPKNNKKSSASKYYRMKNLSNYNLHSGNKPISKGDFYNCNLNNNYISDCNFVKNSLYSLATNNNDQTTESEEKIVDGKVYTTVYQVDELTPLPRRIGGKKHVLAEHDFNEAQKAAVTCRRIEYSYNLRNVTKTEVCLDQIIYIQRWWRKMLKKKNEQNIKKIMKQEKIRLKSLQPFKYFLNEIHFIYYFNLIKKYFLKLKLLYAKLYFKRLFTKKAIIIQRTLRPFLKRQKLKYQLVFKAYMKETAFKLNKKFFFEEFYNAYFKLKKIVKLQNFIKFNLKCHKESYFLEQATKVHPFMYFYLKYGVNTNDQKLYLVNYKCEMFVSVIEKWKEFILKCKLIRVSLLVDNICLTLRKKYFNYLIMSLAQKTNAIYLNNLLAPLIENISFFYFRYKMGNALSKWKASCRLLKRHDLLALNIILKIVKKFAFKPFIYNLKKRMYINKMLLKIEEILKKHNKQKIRLFFDKIKNNAITKKDCFLNKRHNVLKNILKDNKNKNIKEYLLIWKTKAKIITKMEKAKENRKQSILKNIIIYKGIKQKQGMAKYLHRWQFKTYKSFEFEDKSYFILRLVMNIIVSKTQKYVFHRLKINNKLIALLNILYIKEKYRKRQKAKRILRKWKDPLYNNKNINFKEVVELLISSKKIFKKYQDQKKIDSLKRLIVLKENKKLIYYFLLWKKQENIE